METHKVSSVEINARSSGVFKDKIDKQIQYLCIKCSCGNSTEVLYLFPLSVLYLFFLYILFKFK